MVFGKRNIQESPLVRLNNVSVPIVESVGFLGISLDSCLSWENHIEKLNLKLNSACAVIRRLRDVVSLNCIRIYYLAHIQSIINYGTCFWGTSKDALKVFKTQKRIIRCILSLPPRASCKERFTELDIMTVPSLYFLSLVLLVKKNPNLFMTNQQSYAHDMEITTRGRSELRLPAHSSSFYENGCYYRAIRAYRSLPVNIKNVNNFGVFRKSVIWYVKSGCFYDFNF